MILTMTIPGAGALQSRFDNLPERVLRNVVRAIDAQLVELVAAVRTKLNGPVLNRRSGRLQATLRKEIVISGPVASGIVSAGKNIPYAAIHEFGGQTAPHVITPRNGKVLAFQAGGKTVFAKSVNHPGSRMPERSYMRSTLTEHGPRIEAAIRKAVSDGGAGK